jgi:hypothetical protein
MAANSIDSAQYVDGSIDLVHMSADSVDSDQYVDGSIDVAHMAANSIDSAQYVDGSIDAEHLAAAQTNITSLGTLTALTVDDVVINGKVVTMTGSSSDTAVFTAGTNGTLSIVTTDDAAAAANITITADGTAELAGTTVTLNSSGGVTIDADNGTITFADAGSSLGTITSSGYTGDVVGDVTGNADTATLATSVTVSANNSTDETVYPVFVDGATGTQGAETDTGLTYNPSSGNLTITGELDAATLDISGNADIDGTLEADAYTVDGTALDEYIADTVGAMVGSNTETGIAVTYQDGDNTLDFVVGTLNQDTTGLAGTATALATGRTIGMTGDVVWTSASFDGSGNVTAAATIQANAVEGSMLNTDVISGQTALTSGLAETDELLVSDAGTIKRMDMSVLLALTDANATAIAIALG